MLLNIPILASITMPMGMESLIKKKKKEIKFDVAIRAPNGACQNPPTSL